MSEKRQKLDPRVERLLLLILEAEEARRLREMIEGKDPDGEDLERTPQIEEAVLRGPERAVIR